MYIRPHCTDRTVSCFYIHCVNYVGIRVLGSVFSVPKIWVRENPFSGIFCAMVFLLFYLHNVILELFFMICYFLFAGFN